MRPQLALLLCLGCLTFSSAIRADTAGRVIFAYGDAQVLDTTGRSRTVHKGEEVAVGESLVTRNGRMQVLFNDGGYVAVQPNTQFKIDEYRYAGVEDGSERSFFNLVKGGIRFITGAIGHTNKQNYKIRTTVATIGIRGSAGRAEMCIGGSCPGRPDGLFVTGHQDVLTIENDTGIIEVGVGQTFRTECSTCEPNQVPQGPDAYVALEENELDFDPFATQSPTFVASEQRDESGGVRGIVATLGGRTVLINYAGVPPFGNQQLFEGATIEVDGDGPRLVTLLESAAAVTTFDQLDTAMTENLFTDGELFMWRWSGGRVLFENDLASNLTGHQSIHYIAGSAPAAMPDPASFLAATYHVSSTTPSTTSLGNTLGAGVVDGTLQVYFSSLAVDIDLTVEHIVTYDVFGSASITGSQFFGTGRAITSDSASSCANGCSGVALSGFFAGTGTPVPPQAGLAYSIPETNLDGSVHGVAGFTVDPASVGSGE